MLNNPAASQVPDQLLEQYQIDASETDMFQRHAIKTVSIVLVLLLHLTDVSLAWRYVIFRTLNIMADMPSSEG